jgi:biopolymer transport protein ExbB
MKTVGTGAGDSGRTIKKSNPLKSWFPALVIVLALVVAFVVFNYVFGSPDNFEGGKEAYAQLVAWKEAGSVGEAPKHWTDGHPLDGNMQGTVYKGGVIVPIGMALFLMVWVFFIERLISIFFMAKGTSSVDVFVQRVRLALRDGDIDGALQACDKQRGSVANVVKAGLTKYREVEINPLHDKETNREAIQKELEEATTLELPMLERNLPIIATIASIGVLVGLFGTVLGMIKAFSALATAGAPDATALATGISEALVNTAIGIGTSALAIVFYNFFTVQIDSLTYQIDEAGYSIVQTYETTH